MAYFKLKTFKGMAPKINNRLLQEDMAMTVRNANLESGHLKPLSIYLDQVLVF